MKCRDSDASHGLCSSGSVLTICCYCLQESLGLLGTASLDLGTPSERQSFNAGDARAPSGPGAELDALRVPRPGLAAVWGGAATPPSLLSSAASTEDALGRPFSPVAAPSAGTALPLAQSRPCLHCLVNHLRPCQQSAHLQRAPVAFRMLTSPHPVSLLGCEGLCCLVQNACEMDSVSRF